VTEEQEEEEEEEEESSVLDACRPVLTDRGAGSCIYL
jgi:hypothetical protein